MTVQMFSLHVFVNREIGVVRRGDRVLVQIVQIPEENINLALSKEAELQILSFLSV